MWCVQVRFPYTTKSSWYTHIGRELQQRHSSAQSRENTDNLLVLQLMPIQLLLCLSKLGYFVWLQAQLADQFIPGAIVSDMLKSESALPLGPHICSACFWLVPWVVSTVSRCFSKEHNLYGLWSLDCLREKKQGEWVQTLHDYLLTWEGRSIHWYL